MPIRNIRLLKSCVGLLACLMVVAQVQAASAQSESVGTRPSETASLARRGFDGAIVIPIKTEISDVTFDSVQRRLEVAKQDHAKLVIFEMDTPGGSLSATLKICDAMKQLRDSGVKVYAWVNREAYSAGTIIALAADGIVMAPNATMGDCQPITIDSGGASAIPEDLEAKAMSPLLEELRDSARRNGYNLDLVWALIRPKTQVFWVVNTETGEKKFVDAQTRNELFGWSEHRGGLMSLFGGKSDGDEPLPDSLSKTPWRYVREDATLGQVSEPIVSDNELLTMRDNRAKAFGFSQATVEGESGLRQYLNISGPITYLQLTWMERAVDWLASPAVRAVLFMLMLLGAYAEFHAPGVGLPGAVALISLVLFLGAPYMAGFTVSWEIAAVVLGLALLAVEVFVIPGFGITGIAGLILLGFGLLASFAPPEPLRRHFWELPEMPITYQYLRHGFLAMSAGFAGAIAGAIFLARYLPRAPLFKQIIIANPTHEQVTVDDPYDGLAKVGDIGRTETLLRPAGKARFGAMLVDVVSQGDYIQRGEQIEVIERCGSRVVVRKKDEGGRRKAED